MQPFRAAADQDTAVSVTDAARFDIDMDGHPWILIGLRGAGEKGFQRHLIIDSVARFRPGRERLQDIAATLALRHQQFGVFIERIVRLQPMQHFARHHLDGAERRAQFVRRRRRQSAKRRQPRFLFQHGLRGG